MVQTLIMVYWLVWSSSRGSRRQSNRSLRCIVCPGLTYSSPLATGQRYCSRLWKKSGKDTHLKETRARSIVRFSILSKGYIARRPTPIITAILASPISQHAFDPTPVLCITGRLDLTLRRCSHVFNENPAHTRKCSWIATLRWRR